MSEREPRVNPESDDISSQESHDDILGTHTADFGDQTYDVNRLFEKAHELPIEVVPVSKFENSKMSKFWEDSTGEMIGPSDILQAIEQSGTLIDWSALQRKHPEWSEHLLKISQADYQKWPLLVVEDSYVIDGMHRLTRAWADQAQTISIQRFETLPPEAVVTPAQKQLIHDFRTLAEQAFIEISSQEELSNQHVFMRQFLDEATGEAGAVMAFLRDGQVMPTRISESSQAYLSALYLHLTKQRPESQRFSIKAMRKLLRT